MKTLNLLPGEITPPAKSRAEIYVVDDVEGLTELYSLLLKVAGYIVRAFNRRAEALAALTTDRKRPDLLIMDCLGDSIPVDRFIQHCRSVHPALRILMASGLSQRHARRSRASPDRFMQKPFTVEEFLHEVRTSLAA
jgi:DNA-binding response OmpR family regulator